MNWDERLTRRNAKLIPATVQPGQEYWRLTDAQWLDEAQSQGSDVFPCFALKNSGYSGASYIELVCNFSLNHSVETHLSYLVDIIFCQLAASITFTYRLSLFLYHILHIFFLCAKKQMMRIYARRIVAMVTDVQASRDRAMMQLIGHAMNKKIMGLKPNPSISSALLSSLPLPTVISWTRMAVGPKLFFQCDLFSSIVPVNKLKGLALFPPITSASPAGNLGFLPTSTLAEAIGDFVFSHNKTSCRLAVGTLV